MNGGMFSPIGSAAHYYGVLAGEEIFKPVDCNAQSRILAASGKTLVVSAFVGPNGSSSMAGFAGSFADLRPRCHLLSLGTSTMQLFSDLLEAKVRCHVSEAI